MIYTIVLLRTTFIRLWPEFFHPWDILLPFIVYVGQRRGLPEGLLLTLFVSHLFSLCSTAPIGVFVFHYLLIFVLARALSYVIYANRWLSVILLVFVLTLISRIVVTLISTFFGHGWRVFSTDNWPLWGVVMNSVVGLVLYRFLGVLDLMTFKVPRMNIEMPEKEL